MQITNSEKMLLAQHTIDQLNNRTVLRLEFDTIIPLINEVDTSLVGILLHGNSKYQPYKLHKQVLLPKLENELLRVVNQTDAAKEDYLVNFGEGSSYGFITACLIKFSYQLDFKTRAKSGSRLRTEGFLFNYDLNCLS